MKGSDSLKSTHMALITFFTQTGVGIIIFPSTLAKDVGHDGWISILVTGFIVIILSVLMIMLLKRYNDKSIYGINELIFGKLIGTVFNIILLLYILVGSVVGASLFNYFMRVTILQQTPGWALAPFIVLPSFYLVWQGLKPLSRFLYISLYNYIIIILFIFLIIKDFRTTFILPVGEAGITRILNGIKPSFFAFIGFELIAFFYPMVSDKAMVMKWQIIAILGSVLFYIIIVVSSLMIFGENFITTLTLPFFNISRVFNAPILERVDLYLTALWFIPMACSMRSYVFAGFDGLQKVLKLKKTKLLYIIFFLVIIVGASFPQNINMVFMLIDIINYAGIGVTSFIVLCFFLSFLRKKGVYSK